jgi:hypothetical protein
MRKRRIKASYIRLNFWKKKNSINNDCEKTYKAACNKKRADLFLTLKLKAQSKPSIVTTKYIPALRYTLHITTCVCACVTLETNIAKAIKAANVRSLPLFSSSVLVIALSIYRF